ncbi:MAG: hypothetical protein V4732_19055 [Pseudomonadota bacterium]
MQLAIRNSNQGPFLTQVITYGLEHNRLTAEHLEQIKNKAVLMSLKFADKFYNKYKMDLLEQAAQDIIGVASLGLAELSELDLDKALTVLTSPENIVKPFQKGWSMLSQVSLINATNKSLYGDVDAHLLANISSAPYEDQWLGLRHYEQALQRRQQDQAITTLKETFFYTNHQDDTEYFGLESMLAEALIYRICCNGAKVKPDLKHKLKNIELQDIWLDEEFLQTQLQNTLNLLPPELAAAIRADLGKNFIQQLINTLKFAKRYQKLLAENASPEKRDNFEYKQSMSYPLLGWPQYIEM